MKTFGFAVSNETFAENSWYFRNALVRANYNDLQNGVYATTEFLELFFENLLMNAGHELKNRYMHIDFENESATQSTDDMTIELYGKENMPIKVRMDDKEFVRIGDLNEYLDGYGKSNKYLQR